MMSTPQGMLEGQFVTRPPYFNGQHYSWWKNRIVNYIQADDYPKWSTHFQKGNQKWELGSQEA